MSYSRYGTFEVIEENSILPLYVLNPEKNKTVSLYSDDKSDNDFNNYTGNNLINSLKTTYANEARELEIIMQSGINKNPKNNQADVYIYNERNIPIEDVVNNYLTTKDDKFAYGTMQINPKSRFDKKGAFKNKTPKKSKLAAAGK